ncbi:MAG: hypothetical protein ABEI53_03440 [Candidatus Magasanikbacteria bacterium]
MNTKKDTHLVIGKGEVGTSLFNVLKEHYDVQSRDENDGPEGQFDVLHICYPPIDNFVEITKKYIDQYSPEVVIIHSTVRPGTTEKVDDIAVHSPIRGLHPNLEDGIKTFVKYFAGPKSKRAAQYFEDIGIETESWENPETTEVLKILSTTYFAWNVVFEKEVKKICDKRDLDFEKVYKKANKDYNEGYKELGHDKFVRPVLDHVEGPIGGHCLVPNCELLDEWITEIVKKRNESY